MRFLVFGKRGQVGANLCRLLRPLGEVVAYGREDVNLMDEGAVRRGVRDVQPQVIINAAAYTAVDLAEQEQRLAFGVNAEAPRILAEEAKQMRALFIHYSTDYVYDGEKGDLYVEEDQPNPLSFYGWSKLQGDLAVQEVGGSYLILRTSWVYGCEGANFLLTMLKLAKEKQTLSIVDDQVGAPTRSQQIALGTAHIVKQLYNQIGNFDALKPVTGLYHLTAAGYVSWYGFAEAIFKHCSAYEMDKKWGFILSGVEPTSSENYPQPAKRPRFSVLSNDKWYRTFGWKMPEWEESLKECLKEMMQHQ